MSNLRLLLVLAGWALLLPTLAFVILVMEEKLEPTAPKSQYEMAGKSPLEVVVFTPERRSLNLDTLGIQGEDLRPACDRQIDQLLQQRRSIVTEMIEQGKVSAEHFCPGEELPVAYRAAHLLVQGDPGNTSISSATQPETFTRTWAGYEPGDAKALFMRWERYPGRTHEDTAIALSALVLGRASVAASGKEPPFDRLSIDGGKLKAVFSAYPEARDLLVRYAAHVIVLGELAHEHAAELGCSGVGIEAPTQATP